MLACSSNERAVDLSESGIMLAPLVQALALIASVPLTDEPWVPIREGEVVALRQGLVWARLPVSSATAA